MFIKMKEEQLNNIREKEEILNQLEFFLKDADRLLGEWKNMQPQVGKLIEYYESEQWREDWEASNRGEIPNDMPHGVLSEDQVFNALMQQRTLAVAYLQHIAAILE